MGIGFISPGRTVIEAVVMRDCVLLGDYSICSKIARLPPTHLRYIILEDNYVT